MQFVSAHLSRTLLRAWKRTRARLAAWTHFAKNNATQKVVCTKLKKVFNKTN